jgi:hypothetical protein
MSESEENHTEGWLVKPAFCTLRKEKDCGCGNDYTSCVKDDAGGWAPEAKYPQLLNVKVKGRKKKITQWWSANAHHILCVAEVTKVISLDDDLQRITTKSTWCINHEHNMMALPLFSHTVLWYMHERGDNKEAPDFENLPNHNYDHGPYNEEVEKELNKIKAKINKKPKHKYKASSLAPTLNRKATAMRKRLIKRGKRKGGTHHCWCEADKGKDEGWYEPFSLADDGEISQAVYPNSFGAEQTKTFERLDKALKNEK